MKILLSLLIIFLLSACVEPKKSSTTSNSTSSASSGDDFSDGTDTEDDDNTSTSLYCDDAGTGDGYEYYRFTTTMNGPPLPAGYSGFHTWDSSINLPEPNVLTTDTKLKMRVKVYSTPNSNLETYCTYTSEYTMITATVNVYGEGHTIPTESFTFSNIKQNECSAVHTFAIPITTGPVRVTITDGHSDHVCIYRGETCTTARDPHTAGGCFKVDLHVETNYTKVIPE